MEIRIPSYRFSSEYKFRIYVVNYVVNYVDFKYVPLTKRSCSLKDGASVHTCALVAEPSDWLRDPKVDIEGRTRLRCAQPQTSSPF